MKKKNNDILLGAHISIAGGLHKSVEAAESIGCTTMQIFTKNNKALFGKPLDEDEVELFKKTLKQSSLSKIMVHSSYLINLGSTNPKTEKNSIASLKHELERCEKLEIPYLVLHPGSHLGAGEDKCIKQIARNLDKVLTTAKGKSMILLETMAGQGTNVGYTFEQLRTIYDLCKHKKRLGICLDTCHIFSAGYDIRTKEGYEQVMKKFARVLGLRKLKAIHINDSKEPFDSRKDRHESIGKGKIPRIIFACIMNDKRLKNIPKVLETPYGYEVYKREIKYLRRLVT